MGVTILGLTTAIGGGLIRDIVLNITAPVSFAHPRNAIITIVTAIIFFMPPIRKLFIKEEKISNVVMLVTDSIGLGFFTVIGVQNVINQGYIDNHFFKYL